MSKPRDAKHCQHTSGAGGDKEGFFLRGLGESMDLLTP